MKNDLYNGSEWRKWDLHFHTQSSHDYKDKSVTNEEIIQKLIEQEIAVVAITDHHFMDVNRIKSLQEIAKEQITILPGIEFCSELGGSESIHFIGIFAEDSDLDHIWTTIKGKVGLTPKAITDKGGAENIHCDLLTTCNLIHELGGLVTIHAGTKTNTVESIKNKTLAKMYQKKDILTNTIDFLEIGKEADADSYEDIVFKEIGIRRPLIICSDNHNIKQYSLKQNCWIKADPTFEGLKQVMYEPKYRVSISEKKPREPMRKINYIQFDFPADTQIKRVDSQTKQDFCLKNLRNKIHFNSYFTCLIGGRGTGKSTIINTLGERLNEKTSFFNHNNLIIEGNQYNIKNDIKQYIKIEGTNEVEFVSQGKVEELAEVNNLTKLIFEERIKMADSEFQRLDEEVKDKLELVDKNISVLFSIREKTKEYNSAIKNKAKIENIIASINDKQYKVITSEISKIKTELGQLENSDRRYNQLLNSIKVTLQQTPSSDVENEIEARINEIRQMILNLNELSLVNGEIITTKNPFENTKQRKHILESNFKKENENLAVFFQEKGTSQEAIKDSQNANRNLAHITTQASIIKENKRTLIESYKKDKLQIDTIKELYNKYEKLVIDNIKTINQNLEVSNQNILKINYNYEFNYESFLEILFNEFNDRFKTYQKSGVQGTKVKEILFLIEPDDNLLNLSYDDFIARLNTEIDINGINRNTLYVKQILEIFEEKINLLVYKLLILKHKYNLSEHIRIKGYYGEKELINCSFGQRCTAVIVTLLMSGVKPLIIDEPEAHLDNRLIADYLVDLIKTKKLDRQIIFATHNSNFVVNGDSELIHILDIPNNDIFTQISSTSIENITNREKLLRLEGGREAFIIRENKYGIN